MTSKPTARERLSNLKSYVLENDDRYTTRISMPLPEAKFLISLVEAAINVADIKENEVLVWAEIELRLAQPKEERI